MFGKKELRPLQKERLEKLIKATLSSNDKEYTQKAYFTTVSILNNLCQNENYYTGDYDNAVLEKSLPYLKGLLKGAKEKPRDIYVEGYAKIQNKVNGRGE